MNNFIKYFEYLIFRLFQAIITFIPFKILYFISNIFAFLLADILKYRHKVVLKNLRNAFPQKNNEEITRISKLFYKNLCDNALESIKGYSLSYNQLKDRYKCLNPEISNKYFEQGRDVIFAMSHYTNWEWGTQVADRVFMHNVATFYKPLSNKYMDDYINRLRSRQKMWLLSIYKLNTLNHREKHKPVAYFMLGDQNPSNSKKAYWINFLNQDTACMRGIETYAKLYNLPVIYLDIQRVKRGFYTVVLKELFSNPLVTSKGEITCSYMKKLEEIILTKPEDWLWSHKRWKAFRN